MSIINIEMMLWMRYKLNPFAMIDNLTISDLTMYTNQLTDRLEEEQKDKTQDKLMKSLVAIRDVLNYMTFSQVSNN
jgi:predicted house-cleaning noncanonical NTP pyrophosphatase (MazG superfamily)